MSQSFLRRLRDPVAGLNGWSPVGVVALVAIVAIAAHALILLVNLGDAVLDPEAARLTQVPKLKLEPVGNMYYMIAGFGAPAGTDAQAAGEKYVAALLKTFNDPPDGTPGLHTYTTATPEKLSEPAADRVARRSCAAFYLEKGDAYRKAAEQYAHLLSRYAEVRGKAGFEELVIPDEHAPQVSLAPISVMRRIEQALAVQAVAAGDAESGLKKLAVVAAHDRLVFTQAGTLVTKLVALRWVYESASLASELITGDPALAAPHHELLARICAPLDAAAIDLSRAFEATNREWMYRLAHSTGGTMYGESPSDQSKYEAALLGLLYRRNETMNSYLGLAKAELAVGAASLSELGARIEELRKVREKMRDPGVLSLFRNTVGKFMAVGTPPVEEYKWRVVDLDGQLRLFGLQLALAKAGVAPGERSGWISLHAPEARSPYDASPLQYDSARRELRFTGNGKHRYLPGDQTTLAIRLDR